jgi:hypothetical protein
MQEVNKAPYWTGHDTLVYISDLGDTAILYGQGKEFGTRIDNSGPGDADCGGRPTILYHNESMALRFISSNGLLQKIDYYGFRFEETIEYTQIQINDFEPIKYGVNILNDPIRYDTTIVIDGSLAHCYFSRRQEPYFFFNDPLGIVRIVNVANRNWTLQP